MHRLTPALPVSIFPPPSHISPHVRLPPPWTLGHLASARRTSGRRQSRAPPPPRPTRGTRPGPVSRLPAWAWNRVVAGGLRAKARLPERPGGERPRWRMDALLAGMGGTRMGPETGPATGTARRPDGADRRELAQPTPAQAHTLDSVRSCHLARGSCKAAPAAQHGALRGGDGQGSSAAALPWPAAWHYWPRCCAAAACLSSRITWTRRGCRAEPGCPPLGLAWCHVARQPPRRDAHVM